MNKYFLNSMSGVVQIIIVLALSVIAIPQLISKYGMEFYGVLSLALIIGNINTFINLGFNASLIKYLTEQGKCKQSNNDIVSVFLFLLFIVVPISLVVIYYNHFIMLKILDIPPQYITKDMLRMFSFLVISNIFIFLTPVLSAVLDSIQKIYITNTMQSVYNIFSWGLLLLVINITDSVVYIGVSYLIAALIWFGGLAFFARKFWGKVYIASSLEEYKRSVIKQLSYGMKIYASGIINFFSEPLTKIIISHFFGLNIVTAYDIALKIKILITNLFFKIYYPLYPYIAQISDKNKLRNLIHIIEQKAYFISVPIFALIIFAFPPLIDLWLKQENDLITVYIILITSGYAIFSVNMNPIYFYLMVKGHPEKTIVVQSVYVIINGGLLLIMCFLGNLYAPAISNFLGILSTFLLLLYYQKKYLGSLIFDKFYQVIKLLIIFIILCGAGYIINSQFNGSILKLTISLVAISAIAVFLYRVMKVFVQDDINAYIRNSTVNKIISRVFIGN